MKWISRSARQMPLHDLKREKRIVRKRMTELASYGSNSRGLAHYALCRGHMALLAYSQALLELEQAIALGVKSAPYLTYTYAPVLDAARTMEKSLE